VLGLYQIVGAGGDVEDVARRETGWDSIGLPGVADTPVGLAFKSKNLY